MLTHPNCKINLGLVITERRPDGYHNLETIFLPVDNFHDELEINPIDAPGAETTFCSEGTALDCADSDNIVLKAYRMLLADFPKMGPVSIRLRKAIPFGAGLGGGSADAAFTLCMLNQIFELGLSAQQLCGYAARLGADCSVFVLNRPVLAKGIGELMTPLEFDLRRRMEEERLEIRIVKPDDSVSTKEAYARITPRNRIEDPELARYMPLHEAIALPVEEWKNCLVNDFEPSVFPGHPAIARLKEEMYEQGALYASMTGSGAAVYGIFRKN